MRTSQSKAKEPPKTSVNIPQQFFNSFLEGAKSLSHGSRTTADQVKLLDLGDDDEVNDDCNSNTMLLTFDHGCFCAELPIDMIQLILSFLSPIELYPLRFTVSRSFDVLVERSMERWVKSRDRESALMHDDDGGEEEQSRKELFTAHDLESGLFSDVFASWSDLARNRYLYEQMVPNCCTSEDILLLKNSRSTENPPDAKCYKIMLLGKMLAGKTMFFQHVFKKQPNESLRAKIIVDFSTVSFAIGSEEENRFLLHLWDTSDHPLCTQLNAGYGRGSHCFVFMVPLNDDESMEWLRHHRARYCSGLLEEATKCIVIGTKKDLKKDNRLSYDLISYCAQNHTPYYECDLRDHEQMFRVLYAIMHYLLQT